jgi:hypothetical protein
MPCCEDPGDFGGEHAVLSSLEREIQGIQLYPDFPKGRDNAARVKASAQKRDGHLLTVATTCYSGHEPPIYLLRYFLKVAREGRYSIPAPIVCLDDCFR